MNIKDLDLIHQLLRAAKQGGSSVGDKGKSTDGLGVGAGIGVAEQARWQPKWKITKYHGEARPKNLFAVEEFAGNLLLNEGITELLKLLIGDGTATAFNNANSYIGVGDDGTTGEVATQTDLQALVNKTYKAMDVGYPSVADQTVTFRSTYGIDDANYDWQEFTVANGVDGTATNLNRKVENHGTKASGDTWVVSVSVTIS